MSYIEGLLERAVGGEFSDVVAVRRDSARDIECNQRHVQKSVHAQQQVHMVILSCRFGHPCL